MKTKTISAKSFLFLLLLSLSFFSAKAQSTSCEGFTQTVRSVTGIDDCGQGGRFRLGIVNGVAPFSINLRNFYTNESASATVNRRNVTLALPPGTYQVEIEDTNGCETVTRFSVFSASLLIQELDCVAGGNRAVRFSNSSNSNRRVNVRLSNSVGFNLSRGTSSTFNLPEGTFSARVSRSGCTPYNVAFGVNACESSFRENTQEAIDQKMSIEEDVTNAPKKLLNAKTYPNPAKNEATINLGLTTSDDIDAKKLVIYNTAGFKVLDEDFSGSKKTINTESFEQGIYFLNVISEDGNTIYQEKLIKN